MDLLFCASSRLPIDANSQHFLDTIENLKDKSKAAKTIVSVAGATGAGKSSLVNAVLCEEKLLPTNGTRGEDSVHSTASILPMSKKLTKA